MKNKNKIANVCIVAGIICIFAALALAILNEYENKAAYQGSQRILDILSSTNGIQSDGVNDEYSEAGDSGTTATNVSGMYEMPTREIEGNEYIGYVSFNDTCLPVMSDWDYTKLKLAPCRYSGSLKEHNLVIAGHNYRDGFRALKNLKTGDLVYFNALNGKIYQYEVDTLEVLEPTEIEAMTDSQWDLSLYTCTYEGKLRFTVRCRELKVFE